MGKKQSAATKDTEGAVTTKQITRQLPCAFPEGDAMLKAHQETIEKAVREVFPIEEKIAKLVAKAKPFRDIIKDTLEKIEEGTTEEIDCTETVNWKERTVTVTRDDTGDVVETRDVTEDDGQMKAPI